MLRVMAMGWKREEEEASTVKEDIRSRLEEQQKIGTEKRRKSKRFSILS